MPHQGWNDGKNRVKVKGSPNLGNVQVMMMGVRNRKGQVNTGPKSVEVWVNELRLTDFDQEGGWAANARVTTRLADLGTVTVAGRHRSAGFGNIDQNVNQRSIDNLSEIDVSSSVDLGRFFPRESGVRIPVYYGYSRSNRSPKYDPLNPDIELNESLKLSESRAERDSIREIAQDLVVRKSLNLTNVKVEPQATQAKKPRPWDPGNFAATYSYNELFSRNINTEYNIDRVYRGMLSYNFNTQSEIFQPFQNVKGLNKGPLALIGDFNLYPLPNQLSFRTDLYRRYNEVKTRNITNPGMILPMTFQKDFLWNRFFDLRYDITRSLKFDFSSKGTARIDEPEGRLNRRDDDYAWKKDSILSSLLSMGRPVLYDHNFSASYNLPLQRIKLLSFLNASARYQGTYNWIAGPITADTIRLGNTIENSQNLQLMGNLNLSTIYNQIPYLKQLDEKFQRTSRLRTSQSMTGRTNQPVRQPVQQPDPEYSQRGVRLETGKPVSIKHNLNLKVVTVKATTADGQEIRGSSRIVDRNTVEFTPTSQGDMANFLVTGKPDKNFLKDAFDLTLRMLTGVRTISINYSIAGGSSLPGYLPQPVLFGAGRYTPDQDIFGSGLGSSMAPGMPFLLGWQDRQYAMEAGERGWMTTDPLLNMPFMINRNDRFTIRANVEPLPDLRLDINADRSISKNISEFYNWDAGSGKFNPNSLTERGNFSMSVLTWSTAFFAFGKEEVPQSEAFQNLKDYRLIIARRLAASRPANQFYNYDPAAVNPETGFPDGYGPTSVEVMVPAFLAAYQGADPYKVSLGMFPSIKYIRPNWRLQYEGMVSQIPMFSKYMQSMSFTHTYRSSYTVGSFLTNLNYMTVEDGFSYIRDIQNNFLPAFEFNSVSINESFSPLINMDILWNNDLSTRSELKRSRSNALSLANNQITEVLSNEIIVGLGYRFTRMDLIIKTKNSQRAYSNDLTLRTDLSFRKNKTVLRRLAEETDQLTAGQNAVTIKTTADYMLSDRFQMRVYFDKVINEPFTSVSFPTSNTNIGVSFRFTLAN